MSFWEIVMSGPEDSPYAEGTFLLYLHADEGYPTSAPKARFVTRIKHPNVNAHGRICHSILDRDWTTDTAMADVLSSVYALLFQRVYGSRQHHGRPRHARRRVRVRQRGPRFRAPVRDQVAGGVAG